MRLSSLLSFLGFVLLLIGTYCPLLRPLHLFNWDVYQLNQPYGIVLLFIAVIGIAGSVLNQRAVPRAAAWVSFALVILLLAAAYFKVHAAFSFIPFKGINAFLTRQIKFKWGWFVLFAGPVLAIAGAIGSKPKSYIKSGTETKQNNAL